nr:glycosyltransferase family 2 protein [Conexibacter sp. DBS9H8]
MTWWKWLLLGIRPEIGAERPGERAQTRWGRWWERHPRTLRLLALIALGWGVVYLVWRIGWSAQGANLWLSTVLLVCESYGLYSLAMLTWFGWERPAAVRPPLRTSEPPTVDVYVCTYDEPESVLSATLIGCAALRHPHTTYLLDDGHRPEAAALAAQYGARYLTRTERTHAKAGNINSALERTEGTLVLVLDADHVPLPDTLDALVGYFDDPRVALVQTPHDFSNHDSVQHYEPGRHEQSVFFSVVMPGKDRHNAAFWCGSGAVIRRAALREVGGVATDTIAEDFHTTIKLHQAGWRTRYHDEVLIQGLAPHDLASYLLQRDRWARGNLAVFGTRQSPLWARRLTVAQRLSYFGSLTSYLAGPVRLLTLATLAAMLWSGQLALHATVATLGLLWAPATLLSIGAGSGLCRGYQRIADTTHFELSTAEIYGRALRCVIHPGRTTFRVTPKEGVDVGGWTALSQLRLLLAVAGALTLGVIARLLTDLGVGVLPPVHGIARWIVPTLALIELRRVLRTLVRLGGRSQLRTQYRVSLHAPVSLTVAGLEPAILICHSTDLTPAGIGLRTGSALPVGLHARALVSLPTLGDDPLPIALGVEIVSCRPAGDGWAVGALIRDADPAAHRRLLEYCHVLAPLHRLRGRENVPPVAEAPFGTVRSLQPGQASGSVPPAVPVPDRDPWDWTIPLASAATTRRAPARRPGRREPARV